MPSNLLCLHTGATRVPLSALDALPTPPPTSRRTKDTPAGPVPLRPFVPIPHAALVAEVRDYLTASSIRITDEEHAVWGLDASRYFGLLHLRFPSLPSGPAGLASYDLEQSLPAPPPSEPTDFSWLLGLRNAHDTSMSAGGVLGTRVFVCDNTAFTGEISFSARHTLNIARTFKHRVAESLGTLLARRTHITTLFSSLKSHSLDPSASRERLHDLTIRLLDLGILTTTSIAPVLRTYRTGYFKSLGLLADSDPSTPTSRPSVTDTDRALDHTLWGFYNTVTDRLRDLGPTEHARRTSRLTSFFSAELLASPSTDLDPIDPDPLLDNPADPPALAYHGDNPAL